MKYSMDKLIEERRDAILDIAERHGVTDVRIFGSMARGTAGEESDVDILVRPLPGTSLFDLGGPVMDVQELLGRHVDVVSERALQETRVEFERNAKLAMFVKLFEMKKISSGMAASILGMERVSFILMLHQFNVMAVDLPEDELQEDVRNA